MSKNKTEQTVTPENFEMFMEQAKKVDSDQPYNIIMHCVIHESLTIDHYLKHTCEFSFVKADLDNATVFSHPDQFELISRELTCDIVSFSKSYI